MRTMLLLTLLLAVAVGCGGPSDPAPAPATEAAEPAVYRVRGVFDQLETDGASMIVQHEEIPGFMAAMTMPFDLEDPTEGEQLEYGDKIEFEYVVTDTGNYARAIAKLPPETELKLVPGA